MRGWGETGLMGEDGGGEGEGGVCSVHVYQIISIIELTVPFPSLFVYHFISKYVYSSINFAFYLFFSDYIFYLFHNRHFYKHTRNTYTQ